MRQGYYTDLTQSQWDYLEPLIPAPKPGGRPRTTDMIAVSSARSSTSPAQAVSGACCPMTFQLGQRSIPISITGAKTAPGPASTNIRWLGFSLFAAFIGSLVLASKGYGNDVSDKVSHLLKCLSVDDFSPRKIPKNLTLGEFFQLQSYKDVH